GNANNFMQIADVSPFATTFTDTTLSPAIRYFYKVEAKSAVGNSAPSNLASVLTPVGAAMLQVIGIGSSQVNLAWTATAGTTFNVLRSTDGVNFGLIATVSANVTTYSDTGLSPNVYFYQVKAFDQFGNTTFSNIVRVTVGEPVVIDHSAGFASNGDLKANGSATFSPNANPVGIFAGHEDVGTQGDPSPAGSATFDSSTATYTLTASGSDIWDVSDHMQYVYERLSGDGSIVARLINASVADFWTKTGVMIRADLSAGAANDFMLDTPNPSHQEPIMQFRD